MISAITAHKIAICADYFEKETEGIEVIKNINNLVKMMAEKRLFEIEIKIKEKFETQHWICKYLQMYGYKTKITWGYGSLIKLKISWD